MSFLMQSICHHLRTQKPNFESAPPGGFVAAPLCKGLIWEVPAWGNSGLMNGQTRDSGDEPEDNID